MVHSWLQKTVTFSLVIGTALFLQSQGVSADSEDNWPSFRGPRASGVAEGFTLPGAWDLTDGEGQLWKTSIPGLAHSSPVVWGDRICLTSARRVGGDSSLKVGLYGEIQSVEDEGEYQWIVLCLDKTSGEILWQHNAYTGVPKVKRHTKSTHANSTPVTDGKYLIAFFGSEGLYGYDLEGNQLWHRDLGVLDSGFYVAPSAQWGFGSSPVIHQGRVVVQVYILGDDFIAAFDAGSGEELWRTAREEVPTWSTPTIYESPGATRIAVNGWQNSGGYDFETGAEIWRFTGGGDIPVPTPIVAHDLIFLTSSHGLNNPVFAIRTGAVGNISLEGQNTTNEFVVWGKWRDGAYMPTPVAYRGHLYVLRDNGTLFCYDARTGEERYKVRVGAGSTGFSASPVAGDGKVYLTSEMGDVYVVAAGPDYELLGESSTGEVTMATPAISQGVLYFRTRNHLLAIGSPGQRP